MGRAVIAKDKNAGYSIRVGAYVLDEDQFGTWLWTPAGSVARYFNGDDVLLQEWPNFLSLAQSAEWFWAGWWIRPDGPTVSTDACTPPRLVDGTWFWTDLELDIVRDHTGAVWVEDEDEFDEGIAAGHIAPELEQAARAVTIELERRLRERVSPFDDIGWRRHDAALALGLPPLEEPLR